MKHLKRMVAVLLTLACLLSALPFASYAVPEDRSGSGNKLIALTFDDGPGKDTKRLLDALRARGVHCTFFIVGYCAAARKDVVRQCYEDGHQVASHTYDHPMLTKKTDDQIRWQMSKTAEILDSAIGASNTYMLRPPYGDYNQRVLDVVGVPAFYWSDDSGDWRTQNSNTVYNNVIRTAGDGDILLLHDSHSWSVDAAIRVVDTLLAQGYEFVTVSELFRRRGVELKAGKAFEMLSAQLSVDQLGERALPPVIVLLSDGQPTDDYKQELANLLHQPWGKKSVRIAIAIGQDADMKVLSEFTGNRELVLQANNAATLIKMIKWASTVASVVSAPASRINASDGSGESKEGSVAPAIFDMNNIPSPDEAGDGVW